MFPRSMVEHSAHGIDSPRKVILFLAANPFGMNRLAFDEECAAIERELRMTASRDEIEFRSRWAITVDEVMRHFNETNPMVIHFSGHGHDGAEKLQRASMSQRDVQITARNEDLPGGIYLQDEHGGPQIVPTRALKMMIKAAAASARVLVLNACYSASQAKELRTVVDCVIGMTGAIRDDAARSFAVGFYRALGNRRSIGNAVEQAIATLAAKRLPDEHLPRCQTRKGVNAKQMFLNERAGA